MNGGWIFTRRDNGTSGGGHHHGHGGSGESSGSIFQDSDIIGASLGSLISGDQNSSTSGNSTSDAIQNLVQQFFVKEVKEHRQTIIVTSVFSMVASALVMGVVLYDARSFQRSRVMVRNGKMRATRSFWTSLHPAEVFALAVAVAAVIQSVVFIGVQSTTLASTWATGCELTAQLLWPASWLVSAMILVFSLEIMFRSLRRSRFKPRGRWTVLICVAVVILLTLALWLSAFLSKANEMCWGSLLWWMIHYGRVALVLVAGLLLTNLVTAAILIIQLVNTPEMDKSERISATRVVYSLGMNAVILTFILPFWATVAGRRISITASEIADVVVTLNGLLQGVLHLLLRVNSDRLAIRASGTPWAEKRRIRLFGPNDVNIHDYISPPLALERESTGARWSRDIKEKDIQKIKLSQAPAMPSTPLTPQPPITVLPPRGSSLPQSDKKLNAARYPRRPSNAHYSLFPTEASRRMPVESWATDFSTDSGEIEPPAPLFSRRHGRNASTQTSETVEFALRLSNPTPDMLSPIAPTPLEPVAHSPLSQSDGILSPLRYVRPRTPTSPAVLSDVEAVPAQATTVAFERPKAPVALRSSKLKKSTSLRDSLPLLGHRRRQVDKSLPPLPRDSALDGPAVQKEASTKAPNWRDSTREHKPQYGTQQRVPYNFASPMGESHPRKVPPQWI